MDIQTSKIYDNKQLQRLKDGSGETSVVFQVLSPIGQTHHASTTNAPDNTLHTREGPSQIIESSTFLKCQRRNRLADNYQRSRVRGHVLLTGGTHPN